MPYIAINTTQKCDRIKREAIKSGLGTAIALLPNKTEKQLMIQFSEGNTMYLSGEEKENCAFIDVRIYGAAGFAMKAAFTAAVFELLEEVLDLAEDEIYLSFGEFNTWGSAGKLK